MNKVKALFALSALSLSLSSCFLSDKTNKDKNNQEGNEIAVTAEGNNGTEASDMPLAKDFSMNDMKGNKVRLMSVVAENKITILDFWASWCMPCMREMPNLVGLYDKYKDEGLQIIGVSLDNEQRSWQNAVETMGMKWVQVSDLKGWENAAAQLYQVEAIPHTVILDSEGHIMAEGLRGQQLAEFIQAFYSEQ